MRAKRSNWIVCGLTAALLLGVAACGKQERASEASMAEPSTSATADAMPASAPAPQEAFAKSAASDASAGGAPQVETGTTVDAAQVSSSAATYEDGRRKFIRNAQARFRVKDVYASALAIEDVAAQQGGFVVGNEISAQTLDVRRHAAGEGKLIELAEYTVQGTLTVRVPSDKTQLFLRAIATQMAFLDQRGFSAADAQFQMLRQQLAAQREQLSQLELGQAVQSGDRLDRKADAILARGSARLQRDEALIQEKEFQDKVDFSTITLSLYQGSKIRQTEMVDVDAVFEQHGPGFFTRLLDALRVGWYGLLDVLLGLLYVWPLWLALAVVVFSLRRWRAGRRATRVAPPIDPAT